jgi:hypothetical protein
MPGDVVLGYRLQQPIGGVDALSQLGNGQLHGADAGVETAPPVAIAGVLSLVAALTVGGAVRRQRNKPPSALTESHSDSLSEKVGVRRGAVTADELYDYILGYAEELDGHRLCRASLIAYV